MASIGAVSLAVSAKPGSSDVTVTYSVAGSAFDVSSGQPYTEICRLMGDDTGIVPAEDNVDDIIPNGVLRFTTIVFPNTAAQTRTLTKTIANSDLDEDNPGVDELRAVVTLTPLPASKVTRESNQVVGSF